MGDKQEDTAVKRQKEVPIAKGIRQTDFTPTKGNALQACIATVLGLELNDVPNFIAQEGDLYDSLRAFLKQHGLGFMKINLNADGTLPFAPGADRTICLLAGQSPRGSHKHVVVAELPASSIMPQPLFDPHPSEEFLKSYIWVGLFVVLRPASYLATSTEAST